MARSRANPEITLKVKVGFEKPDRELQDANLAAYLFSRSGRFLTRKKLKVDPGKGVGTASFKLEPGEKTLIVKLGPDTEDMRSLDRHRLAVKRVEIGDEKTLDVELAIVDRIWRCWIYAPYVVTGDVVKVSGGETSPICVGKVDIYDVDVHCLLRLADPVIERLRDAFIDVVLDPPPIDIRELPDFLAWAGDDDDWCGTPPRPPGPWPPRTIDIRRRLARLPKEWSFAVDRLDALESARPRVDQLLRQMPAGERQIWLDTEPTAGLKTSEILYSNTDQFRKILVDRFQTVRYWLCWYPWIYWMWWPWCRGYCLEHLGTADIEPDGSFTETVWLSLCRHDVPDLWFVVRQKVDGTERVIYARHPVLCHTYWNHPSGDPVTLRVTDPDAVACGGGPQPDHTDVYVMPLGIGNDGWYDIHYAHTKLPVLLELFERHAGLYDGTDPYGTTLHLRMQFHDDLISRGVEYYRWSYAPAGTDPLSFTSIGTPITHRYLTSIGSDFYIVPEQLGPNTLGGEAHLFKVPDPAKDWIALTRHDRAFAIWRTATWDADQGEYVPQIADGRYVLKLEMFDAGGNPVAPSAATYKYFLPTSPPTGGLWPVDDDPQVQADGSVHFNVYVDNTDTVADVQSVGLGGVPTQECQFIQYTDRLGDEIEVTFIADHHPGPPRDFIRRYSMSVRRGISGTTVGSASQNFAPPGTLVGPDYDPPGTIVKRFGVDDLLRQVGTKGPFSQCTFSVQLHTYPRTRDGFSRIRAYESHDVSAFALVPAAP